jgi:hypothetical protein
VSRRHRTGRSAGTAPSLGPLRKHGVRALAVLTLAGGVAAGLRLDDDHEEQVAAANSQQLLQSDVAEIKILKADLADKARETAHQRQQQAEAQARADAEAKAAAERARAAEKEASRRSANRTTTTYGPIPSSCAQYSGNRAIGCAILLTSGFGLDQMPCLDKLWTKESGWNHKALNKSSGAYGIPQALPATKMASMGSDWRTNPITQIRWGLWYIGASYGDPCNALAHSNHYGYY